MWKNSLKNRPQQERFCIFDSGTNVCPCVIFESWWSSPFTDIIPILPSMLPLFFHWSETNFKNCMVKHLKEPSFGMFANTFNKLIQKNNARYTSQKLESLFLLCTWGILHVGLWLTCHTVCAGWRTCGVLCEGGKSLCIQVQILNMHSVKLSCIITVLWTPGNIWTGVNANL